MSGRQLGGERSPSFVRLLMVMALVCLAPVAALGLVGAPEDNDNVTAAGRTRPSALAVEAPSTTATTAPPATTTTADPGDHAPAGEAPASSTTTATTPVTEPPTTAAPTTTAAPATTTAIRVARTAADEVLDLVNAERAAAAPGCDPLTVDDRLASAAQGHSDDMSANGYFSHTSLDGTTAQGRAEAAGFTGLVGENIAAGYRTPEDVMAGWMGSDGHRANILNCDYTVIGVGLNEDGWYWTQMFGTAS